MKNRCVIVGAGPIENYIRTREYLKEDDFFIFCDGGLRHRAGLGVRPDLIIGDFDSFSEAEARADGAPMVVLPREKDDTDTVAAAKEGLSRGFKEFLLIGAIGGRLDHTLGNVYLLEFLAEAGARGEILTDREALSLVGKIPVKNCKEGGKMEAVALAERKETTTIAEKKATTAGGSSFKNANATKGCMYTEIGSEFEFFSLIALDGVARGVTITGAKYNLTDAEITPSYQYGVSNEVLPGETARVSVKEGVLLLMKDFSEEKIRESDCEEYDYDCKIAEDAYQEYVRSGCMSTPIEEFWKELDEEEDKWKKDRELS